MADTSRSPNRLNQHSIIATYKYPVNIIVEYDAKRINVSLMFAHIFILVRPGGQPPAWPHLELVEK